VKHIPSIIISEFRRFSGSCSYESMSLFFVINPPAASEPELVSDTWSTDQFTALGIRREKLLCLPVCWGFTVLVYCGMEKNCCSRPAAAWFVPTGKSWVITGLRCGLNERPASPTQFQCTHGHPHYVMWDGLLASWKTHSHLHPDV
jgi:hypothetical protein